MLTIKIIIITTIVVTIFLSNLINLHEMLSYKTIYDSLSKRTWRKNKDFIIGTCKGEDDFYYNLSNHDLCLYREPNRIPWRLYTTIFMYFSPYSLYYHFKFKKWIKENVIENNE